jgi:hypothetical protein
MYRGRTEAVTTGRNIDAGLTFSGIPAFSYICQHPIAKITPSAAIYGRALGILFTNRSSMDMQGVSPSTASSMDMPGCAYNVSLSTASRMYPLSPPAV